jgi:diaminopimelate decarboxylase
MAACEIAKRPQPAVPTVIVSSGLGKAIMASRIKRVIAQPAHMGCSSSTSLKEPICETDTFGLDRRLNEVREGDILAICNAGAYGFAMSNNYNSRLRPAEVLIYKEKAYLARKREVLDDLLRNQVEVPL